MVSGLLFKWEDSQSLNHHCGFCERPLSHPGARASCFGEHSEPCHRFHQMMFMRNKSHNCKYCCTIEEAYHRRHKKIAEGLRDVYESCGLTDWIIEPIRPEERGRTRGQDPDWEDGDDTSRMPSTEGMTASKREKKDAKALARAASRSRLISQEEIAHVESILHGADGPSDENSGRITEPRNTEEMEEIERHLKYNAHVYNTQTDRRALRRYAQLPDVDVDFDAEIERILEAFRVNELLRMNTRNRGLQGKQLKTFQDLVEMLKQAIVGHLIQAKQVTLETSMRRAGYLRYTNKAAHDKLEDRYTGRNWKTGEKYAPAASDSSDVVTPVEECDSPISIQTENSRPTTPQQGPDRRHLQHTHMRVTGDDGLGQKVIEPYHAPLLPMDAALPLRKPAVQLKVVMPSAARKKPSQPDHNSWNTVISKKKPKAPSVKPDWGVTATGRFFVAPPPPTNPWGDGATEIPDARFVRTAPEVEPPAPLSVTVSSVPDGFVDSSVTAVDRPDTGHDIVSQKKAKKYAREAQRKARKKQEKVASIDLASNDRTTTIQIDLKSIDDDSTRSDIASANNPLSGSVTEALPFGTLDEFVNTPIAVQSIPDFLVVLHSPQSSPCPPSPVPLRTVHSGKHIHWMRFERQFIVDQLSGPFLAFDHGCTHLNTCLFQSTDEIDCPFCLDYCPCMDPLADQCYLALPHHDLLIAGHYNRLRGEKLLAMCQQVEHYKDRIMLVDDDMIAYFKLDLTTRLEMQRSFDRQIPKRIAREYTKYSAGYMRGPLMEQEMLFERLRMKNNVLKRKLSQDMLVKAVKDKFEMPGRPFMCYCKDYVPEEGLPKDVVECAYGDCSTKYFHKACVSKFGVKKVSHWYCAACAPEMRILAHQTLRDMGYDDIPDEGAEFDHSMEVLQGKMKCLMAQ